MAGLWGTCDRAHLLHASTAAFDASGIHRLLARAARALDAPAPGHPARNTLRAAVRGPNRAQSAGGAVSRGAPAFDGIAEVWYDSWEEFSAAANDPAAQPALSELLQDERRFIDLARSPVWINEIREIF